MSPVYLLVGDKLMFSKGKYIQLKDREIDLFLLKLLTIYPNYDLCEALLLIILTTDMGEA